MPTQQTTRKAKDDLRQGYRPSTAAGEFVREEMHHKRQGKHGAETRRQAIAIGLSKARRAGIPVKRRPGRAATRRPARKGGRGPATRRRASTSTTRKRTGRSR